MSESSEFFFGMDVHKGSIHFTVLTDLPAALRVRGSTVRCLLQVRFHGNQERGERPIAGTLKR